MVSDNHLSDRQLQAYLDGAAGADRDSIEAHLRRCNACRSQLNLYRAVEKELSTSPGFMLSADFAEQVIEQADPRPSLKANRFENLSIVFLLVSGVITLSFFVDLSQFARYFLELIPNFSPIEHVAEGISIDLSWPIYAAVFLVLIVVSRLDRWLPHLREKHFSASSL